MSAIDLAGHLWLLVAALGLNLAVGHAGQAVLGQGAFVAIGGYGTVLLADRADWPQGLAVAASVAVAGVAGWLVGRGSARLRGAHLALATWSLAWLAYAVLVAFPGTYGGEQGLVRTAPAELVSRWLGVSWRLTPRWHVVLAAGVALLVLLLTRSLVRGPLGLDLAAVREGPQVAASLGVQVESLRRASLAAAAAIGASAGAALVLLRGLVAPADVSPLLSVQLYAAVLLGGAGSVLGPVVGVALLVALPEVSDAVAEAGGLSPERSRGVVTALLLVIALAARGPVSRLLRPRRAPRGWTGPPAEPAAAPGGADDVVLRATGLRKHYGSLAVVDGVDVDLRAGEVHALVGPNGAGKTTLLRLLAGAVAGEGRVECCGVDVTRRSQQARVRAGLTRTFQQTQLFPGLTAGEQVAAGARAIESRGLLRPLLRAPSWRRGHERARADVDRLLAATGLTDTADRSAEALAHGDQRLVQVARAAATGARALLLDEPAAGMSQAERRRLADAVRSLAGNGTGVLLVEHDMRLVSALADRITVLADGRVLASGQPEDVRRDPAVRAAYLGLEEPP